MGKTVSEKLKHMDESSSLYKAEAARAKSKLYLEKCIEEITYLLKPPSHPAPQQQQQTDGNLAHQQSQFLLFQQHQTSLQQHMQPSPSPSHQPPPPPQQQNKEAAQSHPMRSQSAQSARGHPPALFQERQMQALQPQITVPTGSPVDQNSKSEYGKKETNPFSAATGIEVAMRMGEEALPETSEDADIWDFDDKDESSGSDTSGNVTEEPIDFGSMSHRSNSMNRRKLSLSKRRAGRDLVSSSKPEAANFKVKFALRGHLDVVRAVVFTGGGTPGDPEICTTGDDGVIKRWYIPGNYGMSMNGVLDVDVASHFTHRGHAGIVTCLAACPANGGDGGEGGEGGWILSGGQDATVRVWEAGKVEALETLVGHTDTVWAICVLPSTSANVGSDERVLVASGSADGTVKIWSITAPSSSPRRPSSSSSSSSVNSLRSFGNGYGAKNATTAFDYSLISTISRPGANASPTCISPMSVTGEAFIVSYNDASVVIYDTANWEEVVSMASQETYDGTPATGVSSVVATTSMSLESGSEPGKEEDVLLAGATGQKGGLGGVVITGHEDQYVRIFDANSGMSHPLLLP